MSTAVPFCPRCNGGLPQEDVVAAKNSLKALAKDYNTANENILNGFVKGLSDAQLAGALTQNSEKLDHIKILEGIISRAFPEPPTDPSTSNADAGTSDTSTGNSVDPVVTPSGHPPETPTTPTGPRLIKAIVKTSSGKVPRQLGSSVLTASKGKGAVGGFRENVNPLVQDLHRLFRNDQSHQQPSDETQALAAFEEYFNAESAQRGAEGHPHELKYVGRLSRSQVQQEYAEAVRDLNKNSIRTQQQKQKPPIQDDKQRVRALDSEKLVDHLLEDTSLLTKAFQARLAVLSYRKDVLRHALVPIKNGDTNEALLPEAIATHNTLKERLTNLCHGKPEERRKVHQSVFEGLMVKAREGLGKQGGVQAWINKIIEEDPAQELDSEKRLNLLQEQVFALQNLAMLCVASDTAVVAAQSDQGLRLVKAIADVERVFVDHYDTDEQKIPKFLRWKTVLCGLIEDACGLLDDEVQQPTLPSGAEVAFDKVWLTLALGLKLHGEEAVDDSKEQIKGCFLRRLKDCNSREAVEKNLDVFVHGFLCALGASVSNWKCSEEEINSAFDQQIAQFHKADNPNPAQHTSDVTNAVRGWLKKHNELLKKEISARLGSENSPDLSDKMYAKLVSELKRKATSFVAKAPKDDSNAATQRLNRFIRSLGSSEEDVKKLVGSYLKLSQPGERVAPSSSPKAENAGDSESSAYKTDSKSSSTGSRMSSLSSESQLPIILDPIVQFKEVADTWTHPKSLSPDDVLAIKIGCWSNPFFLLGGGELNNNQQEWVHGALNGTSKTFLAEKTKLTSEQKEDLTNVEKRVRLLVREEALSDADLKTLIANMKGEGVPPRSVSSGSVSGFDEGGATLNRGARRNSKLFEAVASHFPSVPVLLRTKSLQGNRTKEKVE